MAVTGEDIVFLLCKITFNSFGVIEKIEWLLQLAYKNGNLLGLA